jgi:VanZ family protein
LSPSRHFYSVWLPVIIWTAVIATESLIGSSANTGSLLLKLVTWIVGPVDAHKFEVFHHIVRKSGHFLGYGFLGVVWFRAFLLSLNSPHAMRCALLALIATFVTASLDEWHQSFSSARTGQFSDVLLDTCGALVLITLTTVTIARRRRSSSAARA